MDKKVENLKIASVIENYKLTAWQKIYLGFKSVCDIFIGFIVSLILLPFFIFMAIAIKIDSRGPVFFKQKRAGKNGKVYNCLKFRSMKTSAPAYVEPSKLNSNDYITKVGAFMRKTSIDELPQFLCLAIGKMSLIGYRPAPITEEPLNSERKKYGVYNTKPGLTGFAQVNGRDVLAAVPTLKAKYDAYYVQHISLWMDIKVTFKSIGSVFFSKDVVEGTSAVQVSKDRNLLDDIKKDSGENKDENK